MLQKIKNLSLGNLISVTVLLLLLLGFIHTRLGMIVLLAGGNDPLSTALDYIAFYVAPALSLLLIFITARLAYLKRKSWKDAAISLVVTLGLALLFSLPLGGLSFYISGPFNLYVQGLINRISLEREYDRVSWVETRDWKTYRNEFYSLRVPPEWKEEFNDVGSAFDKRLESYTYGSYINSNCGPIPLWECDPSAPSHVLMTVFVYENKDGLDAEQYVKKYIHADFPNPGKLSDGSISEEYWVIPATAERNSAVREVIYYVQDGGAERYYFTNNKYIYKIWIDYELSKADIFNEGIKATYEALLYRYSPIINEAINSFQMFMPNNSRIF